MIARKRCLAIRDGGFVFLAAFVIAISLAPEPPRRQVLQMQSDQGIVRRFTLRVDDPRLAQIHHQVETYGQSRPVAAIAVARWQAETAAFYADQDGGGIAQGDAKVVHVGFTDTRTTGAAPSTGGPGAIMDPQAIGPQITRQRFVAYWNRVRETARGQLASIQQQTEQLRKAAGPAPVSLGANIPGRYRGWTLMIAMVIAGFAVALVAAWTRWQPALELVACAPATTDQLVAQSHTQSPQSERADPVDCVDLPIVLPMTWVHLHQHLGVLLRRVVFVGLFVTAMGLAVYG